MSNEGQGDEMRKDPTLACLLNLLLVGSGHMYLKQVTKGLIILAIGVALGLTTWGIAIIPLVIWAMYDAYKTANKMNRSVRKPLPETTE